MLQFFLINGFYVVIFYKLFIIILIITCARIKKETRSCVRVNIKIFEDLINIELLQKMHGIEICRIY